MARSTKTLEERIQAQVSKNPATGCWIWTGMKDKQGYGRISIEGKKKYVIRVVYQLYRDPIPDGKVLDHFQFPDDSCIGPSCCNPDHLRPTTRSANSARNAQSRRKQCPAGHKYDDENTINEKTKHGKARRCKKCQLKRIRRWQKMNPDRLRAYSKRAYEKRKMMAETLAIKAKAA